MLVLVDVFNTMNVVKSGRKIQLLESCLARQALAGARCSGRSDKACITRSPLIQEIACVCINDVLHSSCFTNVDEPE